MSLHEVPVAVRVGVRGDAFEHHGRGAVAQGAVHDVGVARYPSAIGDTGVHVVVLSEEFRSSGQAISLEFTDESHRGIGEKRSQLAYSEIEGPVGGHGGID